MLQKKAFFSGLPLVLCVILAAPCFGGGQSGSVSGGAGKAGPNPNMNLTGLPIVKDKETYTIAWNRNTLSQNNMPEKEPVIKAIRDTNIQIDWVEIQNANWNERISIMLASGDVTDAIVRPPADLLMQNLPQMVDLTDLIQPYSPVLSNFLKNRPDVKSLITAPNGRIYCFPGGSEAFWSKTVDCLFINKSWLDAAKLQAPSTTDEFYNVLKYFKENDMNGNGDKNDEIPFAFCQADAQSTLRSMFGSFGILDNLEHLQIINDVVTFTPSRPEFLDALRYFNKLYTEGLMDEEGFSQSSQQYTAKGRENPAIYGSLLANVQGNIIGIDKLDDYIPVAPLKGPNGKQLWNQARDTGLAIAGFVITNKCKNPETLVRWYDYVNSSLQMVTEWENGPEGLAWEYDNSGRWMNIMDNVPAGSSWGEYRHTLGPGSGGPQCAQIYDWNNPSVRNISDQNTLLKIASLQLCEPFLPVKILPMGLEEANVIQDRAILYADINPYVMNFIATSVMHGVTDAQWNEHLRNCERLNVSQYAQSYQRLYDMSRR
ncbi:MAG: extracellular solute-binding protein [Treponema sp.]|nr:extracellular solute-binding protein [Treponema sp.]